MHAATTASAVLNCEGALPKLLELLESTSDAAKLNSSLLTASAQVTLTHVPSLDEIKAVIERVSTQKAGANALCICNNLVQMLCVYACILKYAVSVNEKCTLDVSKKLLLLYDSVRRLDTGWEHIVCMTALLQTDVC